MSLIPFQFDIQSLRSMFEISDARLRQFSKPKLWDKYEQLLIEQYSSAYLADDPMVLYAEPLSRRVFIAPLVGPITTLVALHELGHIATVGPESEYRAMAMAKEYGARIAYRQIAYPCEKRAWDWAMLQTGDMMLSREALAFKDACLASYSNELSPFEDKKVTIGMLSKELFDAGLITE